MTAYREIAEKIRQADAVLIGASNGLSITEGLHLFADNQAFDEVFGDLKRKYGLRCILQGMGAKWPSEEEKWSFWSRLIRHYCGEYRETPVMADLKKVIGKRSTLSLLPTESAISKCADSRRRRFMRWRATG